MKIRQRLALRFTLVSALITGAILLVIYFLTLRFVHADFTERLSQQSSLEVLHFATPQVKDVMPAGTFNLVNPSTSIFSESYELLYKTGEYEVSLDWVESVRQNNTFSSEDGEYTTVGRKHTVNGVPYFVFVSDKDLPGQREMNFLEQSAFAGWLIGLVLSYITGFYFSRQALKPMTTVVEEVNKITEDNLSYRLRFDKSKITLDEIDELVITFNALLNRIQKAFIGQKRFVQNASHELKTPLTAIMAEVELGLARVRTTEEYQRTLQVVLQETDRLANITQGFLTLTRLEEGNLKTEMNFLNLDTLINDTLSSFSLHHPNRKVIVTGSFNSVFVLGNHHLLQSALLNLLDNAVKYSDGKIEVPLRKVDHQAIIIIRDYGLGIPKPDLQKVRDPLFRSVNVSAIPGVGLGLSLVERILNVHGGQLEIKSEEGKGTECTISLPIIGTSS